MNKNILNSIGVVVAGLFDDVSSEKGIMTATFELEGK